MNKPQLPDFIQNKIDHYIENYFDINKNGKHLVLGKQASLMTLFCKVMIISHWPIIR